MYYLGIDIGSLSCDTVLIDGGSDIVASTVVPTGARNREAMARALQMDIDDMADRDIGAEGKQSISSMCTVFAESEVVSLIADGAPVNEIVMGLNRAIASRILSLVKRTTLQNSDMKIAMSGGVARNSGVVRAISSLMDCEVSVPKNPDTVGALGAAMIAKEKSASKR